jgi:hypothetical protein
LNEGNIYIGKTTPPIVIKLFQEQFQNDFELFLKLRSSELVSGGRMLLTLLGRKSEEMLMHGDVSTLFELVAKSLQSLVQKVHPHILPQHMFFFPVTTKPLLLKERMSDLLLSSDNQNRIQ